MLPSVVSLVTAQKTRSVTRTFLLSFRLHSITNLQNNDGYASQDLEAHGLWESFLIDRVYEQPLSILYSSNGASSALPSCQFPHCPSRKYPAQHAI